MRTSLVFFLFCLELFASGHIFIYHRFEDLRYPSTSTSIADLRQHFEYFKKNNYEVVPLMSFIEKIQKKENIPDNWVALTVDDGYKSFYDNAYKIFKEYNYPFTMFVYAEATDKKYKDFMSWEELKNLQGLGTLQSHSYAHGHMADFNESEIKQDLQKSLILFEKNLGFKPEILSYPYGEYTDEVKKIVSSLGFKAAVSQNAGGIDKNSDLLELPRSPLTEKSNLKAFLNMHPLQAVWYEPKSFPKDGILKRVFLKVDENISKAHIYISGFGSKQVEIKDGIIDVNLSKKLKRSRTRVVVQIKNKVSTKMLVKEKNDK